MSRQELVKARVTFDVIRSRHTTSEKLDTAHLPSSALRSPLKPSCFTHLSFIPASAERGINLRQARAELGSSALSLLHAPRLLLHHFLPSVVPASPSPPPPNPPSHKPVELERREGLEYVNPSLLGDDSLPPPPPRRTTLAVLCPPSPGSSRPAPPAGNALPSCAAAVFRCNLPQASNMEAATSWRPPHWRRPLAGVELGRRAYIDNAHNCRARTQWCLSKCC